MADMHEDLTRSAPSKATTDRMFGYVVAGFFVIVALLPVLHRHLQPPRLWAIVIAGLFALAAALRPATLKPLNRWWTKFGMLLHHIVSPVVLGAIFYGVMLPIGLFMRLRGKDPLKLRPSPAAQSYWIERTSATVSESMKQQF